MTTTTQRESTTTSPSLLKSTRSTPNSLSSTSTVPKHSNSPTLKITPTSTPYLSTRIEEEHRVSDIDSTSNEIKNTLTNPFFRISKIADADLSLSSTPEKKRKITFADNSAPSSLLQHKQPAPVDTKDNKAAAPPARQPTTPSNESIISATSTTADSDIEAHDDKETETEIDEGDKESIDLEVSSADDESEDKEEELLVQSLQQHLTLQPTKMSSRKGTKALKKKASNHPIPMTLPFLHYQWKDFKRTDLTTIEIHLPAATVPSEFHMQLVEKNGAQFFVLTHTLSSVFLDQNTFEDEFSDKPTYLTDTQWGKDCASWAIAREDEIKKMKKRHCDAIDAKKEFAKLRMEVELPFLCEDIFDIENYHGKYTHAGTKFKPWVTTDETGEEVTMQVLEITLASVKREKEPVKVNTPQRKKCKEVVYVRK